MYQNIWSKSLDLLLVILEILFSIKMVDYYFTKNKNSCYKGEFFKDHTIIKMINAVKKML